MLEHIIVIIKSEAVFAALLGVIVSLIASLISHYYKNLTEKRLEQLKETIRKNVAQVSLDLGVLKISKTIESQPDDIRESSQALIERMEQQILERVSSSPSLSIENIKKDVQSEIQEFKDRIEKIEQRFPAEAQLEKIASINDAILSERIDQLAKKVEGIESKILSKWDVAITVSTIIGGIFAVVAATYGVISFFTASAK